MTDTLEGLTKREQTLREKQQHLTQVQRQTNQLTEEIGTTTRKDTDLLTELMHTYRQSEDRRGFEEALMLYDQSVRQTTNSLEETKESLHQQQTKLNNRLEEIEQEKHHFNQREEEQQ